MVNCGWRIFTFAICCLFVACLTRVQIGLTKTLVDSRANFCDAKETHLMGS